MSAKKQSSKQVDKGLEHQIDESIRRVYQEALSDEIPDRFRSLLDQLRQQDEPDTRAQAHGAEDNA